MQTVVEKQDWFDIFLTWALESGHWTSKSFRCFMKGMFCLACIVGVVLVSTFTSHDCYRELELFHKDGNF